MPFSDSNELPDAKERFYHLPAVPDPVKEAARAGRGHYNAATGRTLFHQSSMPMGEHTGKDMERVPAKYYLWLRSKPWFTTAGKGWEHVRDYIERHLSEIEARAEKERDTSTFDPVSVPLSAPMMPIPQSAPPSLPWLDIGYMALQREHDFGCGAFSIMAATGKPPEAVLSVLVNLNPPYRGWMNPTQMRDTLRVLEVPCHPIQKQTHDLIAGSQWRNCIARVQWENKGTSEPSPSSPSSAVPPFGGPFAGWRNIKESYTHTHYIAHHDGWVLCTATDPTQWITATAWADALRAAGEPWHLTHRWFVKLRT